MVKIVAEIGINHNGDVETACRLICAAKQAGCDYVKFQKRTIDKVYSKEELEKPRESPWGTTTAAQKYGLEFERADYDRIDAYCKGIGIEWFASPWDTDSVAFLAAYGNMPFIKVASASLTDVPVLRAIADLTRMPVVMSTGMSNMQMIDSAIAVVGQDRIRYLLHCVSSYPTATEDMNLQCIQYLAKRYHWVDIGFSNHHPGIVFMPAAVALGAKMVEFHVTLDKTMYGSDQAASFNPDGMAKVVKYIRDIEKAMGNGSKIIAQCEYEVARKLRCGHAKC